MRGKSGAEAGPACGRLERLDRAAVTLDDPGRDGQAEACATFGRIVGSPEALEDETPILGPDARAGIVDGQADIGQLGTDGHRDSGAWRAVPDRIVDEDGDQLAAAKRVTLHTSTDYA